MLSGSLFKRHEVKVNCLDVGQLLTNCYILQYNDKHTLLVDPGAQPDRIINMLKEKHVNKGFLDIYLTHGHSDHIGAVPQICDEYPDAKIYASAKDKPLYLNPHLNLSQYFESPLKLDQYLDRFVYVKDGEVLPLSKSKDTPDEFTVIETPGHTPGSTTLHVTNKSQSLLFTGDTLFHNSVGNTELPLGDFHTLMKSIMEKLYPLEKARVFPGHGEETTLTAEKRFNPFILACLDKTEND